MGGIVPEEDYDSLLAEGVSQVFSAGTDVKKIVQYIYSLMESPMWTPEVPVSATAGEAFSVTIRAKDSEGNTTTEVQRKKQRLCAYRNLIFWFYPTIRRKQRKPLPSCLYSLVRAMFPPTDNEEDFADWEFSKFVYNE